MKNNTPSFAASTIIVILLLTPAAVFLEGNNFAGAQSLTVSEFALNNNDGENISSDLLTQIRNTHGRQKRVQIILQLRSQPGARLNSLLQGSDVRVKHEFQNFNARVLELPLAAVKQLAAQREVKFISPDRVAISAGHISLTTGADAARINNGVITTGLDGTGIGIAILDSGIDTTHTAFLNRNNGLRVVFSKDFTGEGRVDDPYGHGTHVAAVAAGNGRISNAEYVGIAPNANIINLRVLNSQGRGTVSGIVSALDWVLANHSLYNIRVVNASLGTAAVDSYTTDLVCQAARRLANVGIVVVAAAGNNGKDANENKIYGQIHSPGNEPSAITTGASNSFGTDSRADDGVATYSSRGPTRSGWTDAFGVRRHDNLIKPDLVAPGNKVVDAAAVNNLLLVTHPELDAAVSPVDRRRMMYLNGTSMATPVVAGAAALLLQANPTLTPNLVKTILMYTAQPLAGYNFLEQGAGAVNIEGAIRLAKIVRTDLTSLTPLGSPLLTTAILPAPQTTIAGHTFSWAQGMLFGRGSATSFDLITKYQRIYDLGVLVTDGALVINGVLVTDYTMLTNGVLVTDTIILSNGGTLGDGTIYLGSGVLVTDSIFMSDGVLVTDSYLGANSIAQAMSASTSGDHTNAMASEVDTGEDCLDY